MSKKRVNSCTKGKVGERKWRDWLNAHGFEGSKRGAQHAGGVDSPDVVCPALPNVHFEVKYGVKGLDLGTKLLDDAVQQAERDSGGKKWFVAWKAPRSQQWRMTFINVLCRVTLDRDEDMSAALSWHKKEAA